MNNAITFDQLVHLLTSFEVKTGSDGRNYKICGRKTRDHYQRRLSEFLTDVRLGWGTAFGVVRSRFRRATLFGPYKCNGKRAC